MSTMVSTNDGFKIAEVDMELRGPGDIIGTQQSGIMNLKIANLMTDGKVLEVARSEVKQILEVDANLRQMEHHVIRNEINRRMQGKSNWAQIS